ncbi:MAG: ATP-binding protein [Myxococcales bacterium]|nr:ATP-binding protein [Myxococcales bacterium]
MLRYHMVVVTADKAVKRAIKRLTAATGASTDFVQSEREIASAEAVNLAIFDARGRDPSPEFLRLIPSSSRVLYILRGEDLRTKMHLFESPQTTSLFCYNDQFDDDEFISSATKALRGDVFGLQKYFPWGVTSFMMLVKSYEDKTKAIDIITSYAQMAGVRGPVRDRMQLVADELIMNALYHAPTDAQGGERHRGKSRKDLAQLEHVDPVEVQYGCSGSYFGISVRDGFGSLTRAKSLDYLKRAGTDRAQIEDKAEGAGLGLIGVLQSVSKLIFNLDPGYSTEAIGLFDMQIQARGMVGARSLHIFTAGNVEDDVVAAQAAVAHGALAQGAVAQGAVAQGAVAQGAVAIAGGPSEGGTTIRSGTSMGGTWILAAALSAVVAALGTAYYMKSSQDAERTAKESGLADGEKNITVVSTPADATIELNGARVQSGAASTMPSGLESVTIAVRKNGYKNWTKKLVPGDIAKQATLYVELVPSQAK